MVIEKNKCMRCGRKFINENCIGCVDYLKGLCICNTCYDSVSSGCGEEIIKKVFIFR